MVLNWDILYNIFGVFSFAILFTLICRFLELRELKQKFTSEKDINKIKLFYRDTMVFTSCFFFLITFCFITYTGVQSKPKLQPDLGASQSIAESKQFEIPKPEIINKINEEVIQAKEQQIEEEIKQDQTDSIDEYERFLNSN